MVVKAQGDTHEVQEIEKHDINVDVDANATWQQPVMSMNCCSLLQLLPILKYI